MDKIFILVVLAMLAILCAGIVGITQTDAFQTNLAAIEQQPEQSAAPVEFDAGILTQALYVLIGLGVLWVLVKIIQSGLAVPVFFIVCGLALLAGIGYLYTYADKDGDGQGDAQIIKVIQPGGENPDIDKQYSKINEQNVKTNVWSAATITIYAAILLVSMVILTGLGLVLNSVKT